METHNSLVWGRKGYKAFRAVQCSGSKKKWVQYVEMLGLSVGRSVEDKWQMHLTSTIEDVKYEVL